MNIPEDLLYTDEHEWVEARDGGVVRVGITDYAQDALGDVVYVDLPDVGTEAGEREAVAEIESTKSVAEVYAPIAGKVVATNEALETSPEQLNASPYEAGWIFDLEPASAGWRDGLLDAAAYRKLTED